MTTSEQFIAKRKMLKCPDCKCLSKKANWQTVTKTCGDECGCDWDVLECPKCKAGHGDDSLAQELGWVKPPTPHGLIGFNTRLGRVIAELELPVVKAKPLFGAGMTRSLVTIGGLEFIVIGFTRSDRYSKIQLIATEVKGMDTKALGKAFARAYPNAQVNIKIERDIQEIWA